MSEIRVENIIGETGIDAVKFTKGINVTGVTTATSFSGSGASLTSLPAANLTGTLPAISGANLTNVGGLKKLYEVNTTGGTAVNSFTVDGYFNDSLYSHYLAVVSDHYTASSSNSNQPSLRLNVGGSAVTSNNYFWSLDEAYGSGHHNRGNGTGVTGVSSMAQMQGTWNVSSNNRQIQNYEILFFNPTTTGLGGKYVRWRSSIFAQGTGSNGYLITGDGAGMLQTTSAVTGFTMFSANSTTFTYKLSLYGYKK